MSDRFYTNYFVGNLLWGSGLHPVKSMYSSLTDMMMTLAESHETAYYIGEDGYFEKDIDKVLSIWQKYNSSQLVKTMLVKVEQIETKILRVDMMQVGYLLKEIGDVLHFSRDERLMYPLIKVFRIPLTNNKEKDKNLDYLRSMSSLYLTMFRDRNLILQMMIEDLQEEYWTIR